MDDVWRKSGFLARAPISPDEAEQLKQEQGDADEERVPIDPQSPQAAPVLEEVYFEDEDEEQSDDEVPWHWEYDNPKLGFVYWVISSYKPRKASEDEFFLKDCEGDLKPGEICCVLSPKQSSSRFINLISGRTSKADFYGEIVVGGAPKTAPIMKAGTSYLLDGQVLPNYLTVEECLMYTCYFVLNPQSQAPESRVQAYRHSKVNSILKNLGLENVRSKRIVGICGKAGISRAQRVLVNIGRMLLDGKTIVFLDNPTRGLDLIDEEMVITTIFDITRTQKLTVFLSMEHPTKNLLDNFTKLLVLAKGRQLYYGRTQKITEFFRRLGSPLPDETSIYDHLLDLIHNAEVANQESASSSEEPSQNEEETRDHLEEIVRKSRAIFESEKSSQKTLDERKMREEVLKHMSKQTEFLRAGGESITHYDASWCFQTSTLIQRNMKKIIRDPSALILKFIPIVLFLALFGFWFENVAKESISNVDDPDSLRPILNGSFIDLASHDTLTGILISLVGVQLVSLREVHDAIQEAALFKSDSRANHYSQSAYVAAWTVNALLDQAVLIIPYSLATFSFLGLYKGTRWMEDPQDWVTWSYFMGIHVLLSTICEIFVNIFAFLTQSSYDTLQWVVLSNCFFTLFAGTVRRYPETTEFYYILSYLSPIKHAYEGIVLEYMEADTNFDGLNLVSSAYGMDREPFAQTIYTSWIALGVYLVVCYIVFVLVAKRA